MAAHQITIYFDSADEKNTFRAAAAKQGKSMNVAALEALRAFYFAQARDESRECATNRASDTEPLPAA